MRELSIAYGNSRNAKKWVNKTIKYDALKERLKTPIRTTESAEEYAKMSKTQRADAKDHGGFVGGVLKGGRRKADMVTSRSMIALDGDRIDRAFLENYETNVPYTSCLYTTHSSTEEKPRVRIIFPLTRDVTPDEFAAVSRYVAQSLGMDYFDECSYQPNQLMYWPSTPMNGVFVYKEAEKEWLDPDVILAAHPEWTDITRLPTSSRESKAKQAAQKKAEDPLAKGGIVGVFCRTYTIQDTISKFLSDVYEQSAIEGRYDYIPGEGTAGVVIYDDKFAYSHHATDPAGGKLLNAFDLVRVHKFGDKDDKASFKAMCDFAMQDDTVKIAAAKEKFDEAEKDFEDTDWTKQLSRDKNGSLENCLHNITVIIENDPNLKAIVFNALADGMEIKGEVPWKHPARFWRDADDAQLISYIDSHYGRFSDRNYHIAVTKVTDDRSYHPIHEMYEALPLWDGVKRAETAIIDYLGAEDNTYVRAVTRNTLCAAYMRVYHPGIKFDTMLVLNGAQGIGKSTFIAALGMEWFSDSLALSDMNDKTAAEKLQGYWILEIGELAGMKKADIDKVKAFISRQDDKYRASFGRRVTPHPRQCIFFGTTNSENGYLRDITGNRRFWNVKVSGEGKHKPWELDRGTVEQIWAEVKEIAESGEELYLDSELEKYAEQEQREAMEHDDREGLVREYLEELLPDNWDSMNIWQRREFLQDKDAPTHAEGKNKRETVSNMEIWCECFCKPKEDMKPSDSYAISALMVRVEGWEKSSERKLLPIYGRQRVYVRTS